ncbi:hypothetical protein H4582DRAFT_1447597 [Lactarius indigo]|nr:hypothetical protein H4582DRAFT_1447597 [Lactarius indigo]
MDTYDPEVGLATLRATSNLLAPPRNIQWDSSARRKRSPSWTPGSFPAGPMQVVGYSSYSSIGSVAAPARHDGRLPPISHVRPGPSTGPSRGSSPSPSPCACTRPHASGSPTRRFHAGHHLHSRAAHPGHQHATPRDGALPAHHTFYPTSTTGSPRSLSFSTAPCAAAASPGPVVPSPASADISFATAAAGVLTHHLSMSSQRRSRRRRRSPPGARPGPALPQCFHQRPLLHP